MFSLCLLARVATFLGRLILEEDTTGAHVMTPPTLCIERPVMTTLLTCAIVLVGMVGYAFLPVAALPKVDFPTIKAVV